MYQHLAWEQPKRKQQVTNILSRLTVTQLPKGVTASPAAGSSGRAALLLLNEGDQAALLSDDNNITTVQLTMGLTSSDCGPSSKGAMMIVVFARAEGASSVVEPATLILPLDALAGPLPPLGAHDASRPVSLGVEPLAQLTTDLRYDGGDLKHTSLPPVPSIVSRRFEAARTFDKTITALLEPAGYKYEQDKIDATGFGASMDQTFQDRRMLRGRARARWSFARRVSESALFARGGYYPPSRPFPRTLDKIRCAPFRSTGPVDWWQVHGRVDGRCDRVHQRHSALHRVRSKHVDLV